MTLCFDNGLNKVHQCGKLQDGSRKCDITYFRHRNAGSSHPRDPKFEFLGLNEHCGNKRRNECKEIRSKHKGHGGFYRKEWAFSRVKSRSR